MTATLRRATSYDVARTAGVSQSTVSRCFQSDTSISPATRAMVLEVAQKLGYTPNALARGLINRRSDMVGVIATRYTLRGNPDVLYAISEALAAAGKQLMLVTAESDLPPTGSLRGLLEYPLDGLISCVLLQDADILAIRRRGIPIVLYNRRSPGILIDDVTATHAAAGAAVAQALHAAGHRTYACVSGPAGAPVSRERVEGFLHGLATSGVRRTPVIETDFSYAGGRAQWLAYLRSSEPPAAVFCASDQLAFGVMDACRFDLGLRIPQDISVVGFDDVAEAARPTYALTTMRQDSVAMAGQAVALLLARLGDPSRPVENRQVPAALVARGSALLATDISSCR